MPASHSPNISFPPGRGMLRCEREPRRGGVERDNIGLAFLGGARGLWTCGH